MDESSNINATEQLQSSLSAAQQSGVQDNEQPLEVYDLTTEDPLLPTMDDTMNDQQSHLVYDIKADRDSEDEEIHVKQQPDKKVDFSAGVQHSEVNWVASDEESEGEVQELSERDDSPIQCSGNIDGNAEDNNDAVSNSLSPAEMTGIDREISGKPHQWTMAKAQYHEDVYDEKRSIFVDFDEEPDVDDGEAKLEHEEDNQIEEDIGFGFGSIKAFVYPETTQIISQHRSTKNQQSFTTLKDLLSSHNAPGRGLYNVEKVLEHEEERTAELEEQMKYIEAELEEVNARRDAVDEMVRDAHATFSKTRGAAGISSDLWEEYEAFCESLEPKFGNRGGWSVTCFENHNGSYVQWDPELDLFMQSAEMPLGSCNFRCEATKIKHKGSTEYVVEFWPLAKPEPRTETAKTWKQQYPKLYRLANKAANDSSEDNTVAKALLQSLPNPKLSFSGGWLFDYALEPARANHPIVSQRWSYQCARSIPIDGQQDEDGVTSASESKSDLAEDEDVEMEDKESESTEDQDLKMEVNESEWTGSQDVKMEDNE